MRHHRFLTVVLALVAATAAQADWRITDVDGQETRVARGRPALTVPVAKQVTGGATIIVNAGPDTDAANNDFRRIQNAINTVSGGGTIALNGEFDFSAPFAFAAWALGNDGLAGTSDDYSVLVPANLNGVTVRGQPFAIILGPGDLAGVNLEAFLVFQGGDNQNWTITHLEIVDFDLAIGMFPGAGGADAFNGLEISDCFIRVATDLNAVIAPMDVNQNIGLHLSFGMNQQILNNEIHIAGSGMSDMTLPATSVGLQSNNAGGTTYDGLEIRGNRIAITQAPAALPEVVLGIWENGHAHDSDIVVADNEYLNQQANNMPVTNQQRAFRVTSHSGTTSTVSYSGNHVVGAMTGFQWITGFNFSTNSAVRLQDNLLEQCATGVLLQSNGQAYLIDNTILGGSVGVRITTGALAPLGPLGSGMFRNTVSGATSDGVVFDGTAQISSTLTENDFSGNAGFGVRNDAVPLLTAEYNWWGSNEAVAVAAEVGPNIDYDPWRSTQFDLFADGFE